MTNKKRQMKKSRNLSPAKANPLSDLLKPGMNCCGLEFHGDQYDDDTEKRTTDNCLKSQGATTNATCPSIPACQRWHFDDFIRNVTESMQRSSAFKCPENELLDSCCHCFMTSMTSHPRLPISPVMDGCAIVVLKNEHLECFCYGDPFLRESRNGICPSATSTNVTLPCNGSTWIFEKSLASHHQPRSRQDPRSIVLLTIENAWLKFKNLQVHWGHQLAPYFCQNSFTTQLFPFLFPALSFALWLLYLRVHSKHRRRLRRSQSSSVSETVPQEDNKITVLEQIPASFSASTTNRGEQVENNPILEEPKIYDVPLSTIPISSMPPISLFPVNITPSAPLPPNRTAKPEDTNWNESIIVTIASEDDETADVTEEDANSAPLENPSFHPEAERGWIGGSMSIVYNHLTGSMWNLLRHRQSSMDAQQEPDILEQTQHASWAGDGILASKKDLDVSLEEFAAGCGLIQAAARGDIATMERLLLRQKHPATNVNFRDYDRRTALHVAASEGRLEVCQWLVEKHHARLNRSDRWGGSPLDDAYRHRQSKVIQYLKSKGAMIGSRNRSTNLIHAAADGDLDEVLLILSLKPEGNDSENSQQQIRQKHPKLDLNKGNHDKRTALHFA